MCHCETHRTERGERGERREEEGVSEIMRVRVRCVCMYSRYFPPSQRELHNLFRFTSGFEWAQVSYTGERRVVIVLKQEQRSTLTLVLLLL